jgi:hypothetical protein
MVKKMKPKRLSRKAQRAGSRKIRRKRHLYKLPEKLAEQIYDKGWHDGANHSKDCIMSLLKNVLPSFMMIALDQSGLEIVAVGPFPQDEKDQIH